MKYKKILILIIMTMLLVFCSSNNVFAMTVDDLWGEGSGLTDVKNGLGAGDYDSGVTKAIKTIIGLIQVAGTGVSIIMVTMLGIKYILASVEEKAEIKKTAMPILIGAVLLFGAANIVAVIEKFGGIVNK